MKIEEVTKSIEVVNEAKLYLIDMDKWYMVENNKAIDGVILGGENIFRLLSGMAEFVRKHDGFSLAVYHYNIGPIKWIWASCIIYKVNNMWQRVQIENIVCESCGWKGEIANPTIPSLYDTVKDRQGALNFAWNLPEVKCPKCAKKLKRNAIWAQ
jgi:hypothetical protein